MDNPQPENSEPIEVKTQSDLEILLAGYSEPAKSIEPVIENNPTEPAPVQPSQTQPQVSEPVKSVDPNAPYGYYLRGKKKGLPRTTPYFSAKNNYQPPATVTPVNPTLNATLIDGGLFLTLINLVIPLAITLANNHFSNDKVKPDQLKLTKDQIKDLDPICDAVMKQVSMTGNPMVLLLIGLFAAFGLNLMAAKLDSNYKPK